MRPTSGLTFGGRYQLSSRVAIGGMGEVWQATDLVIGRTVAIKILKDEYLGDPGFLERFRAEARHAALVNHEGIANVFDYGEEDGSAFLVMELVPGEALSAIIERERTLDSDRVLDFVAQTALALQAAHAAGLVHRDIKPGNLLITPDNRVKITDFGIARIADQVPLTATGQVMGTVQYLSPEQASGHPASPSTDIYSLGIVAYEMLAGRRPFTGESQVAIAMAQINETPPELPSTVSEPVRNLVYASIAKKPADRPATAAHLARAAQALRRGDISAAAAAVPGVIGTQTMAMTTGANYGRPNDATTRVLTTPVGAEGETPTEETPKNRSPWTWPIIALVAVLAVVLIGTIIALVIPSGDEDEKPPATSSAPATSQPPTSRPPTNTPVPIDEAQIIGKTENQVRQYLEGIGLELDPKPGRAAPSAELAQTAYEYNPTGSAAKGTFIAVTFYGDAVTVGTPTAPTTDAPTPYETGTTIPITWTKFTGCPSGYALAGYQFTVTGGSLSNAAPDANTTELELAVANPGTVTVSYTAKCGDLVSPSASASFTFVAPQTGNGG